MENAGLSRMNLENNPAVAYVRFGTGSPRTTEALDWSVNANMENP